MTVAVIDSNLLLSALINPHGLPARVIRSWIERRSFILATCSYQLHELRSVTRREELARFIRPPQAGRLINQVQALARLAPEPLPPVDASPDPFDNFLLSCAAAVFAQFLVSGDKSDVLALGRYRSTQIVTMRAFATIIHCQ